jgi:hypothetical protein
MAKRKIRFRVPRRSLVTQSALIGDPNRSGRSNSKASKPVITTANIGIGAVATPVTNSTVRRIMGYASARGKTMSHRDAARALRTVRTLMSSGYSLRGALKALFGDPLFEALQPPDVVYADFSPLTVQKSNSHTLDAPFGPAVYASRSDVPKFSGAIRHIISAHPAAPVRRLLTLIPNV